MVSAFARTHFPPSGVRRYYHRGFLNNFPIFESAPNKPARRGLSPENCDARKIVRQPNARLERSEHFRRNASHARSTSLGHKFEFYRSSNDGRRKTDIFNTFGTTFCATTRRHPPHSQPRSRFCCANIPPNERQSRSHLLKFYRNCFLSALTFSNAMTMTIVFICLSIV